MGLRTGDARNCESERDSQFLAMIPPMPKIPGLGSSRLAPAELKRRAMKCKLLVLDVDGVLTDGGMYYGPDGEVMKKFNTRDGQGIVLAMRSGIEVAFLTLEGTAFSKARADKL